MADAGSLASVDSPPSSMTSFDPPAFPMTFLSVPCDDMDTSDNASFQLIDNPQVMSSNNVVASSLSPPPSAPLSPLLTHSGTHLQNCAVSPGTPRFSTGLSPLYSRTDAVTDTPPDVASPGGSPSPAIPQHLLAALADSFPNVSPHASASTGLPSCKNGKKRSNAEAGLRDDASAGLSKKVSLPSSSSSRADAPASSSGQGPSDPPRGTGTVESKPPTYKYTKSDIGPYVVYVFASTRDNGASLHPMLISRIVSSASFSGIVEMQKIGRNKIMIITNTFSAANLIAEHGIFPRNNLKAFIPAFKVLRTGVIRDVPTELSLDHIRVNLESPARILDIQRLNRKIRLNGNIEYVPSKSIRIKFAGQSLPKHVFLYKIRHEVLPFVPNVILCYNCYRPGHSSKVCKSRSRCLHCGEDKHGEGPCARQDDSPPAV